VDPLDHLATHAAELDLTLELRHPGHHVWHLQAVSTPDAVRNYRHFHQYRQHVEIRGALTFEALRQAAAELHDALKLNPPTGDDLGPNDPRTAA
jgi:hypothetical protein